MKPTTMTMAALTVVVFSYEMGFLDQMRIDVRSGNLRDALVVCLILVTFGFSFAVLPLFVAKVGEVSSACKRLEHSIQAGCNWTTSLQRHIYRKQATRKELFLQDVVR